jgi:hypothetical protein
MRAPNGGESVANRSAKVAPRHEASVCGALPLAAAFRLRGSSLIAQLFGRLRHWLLGPKKRLPSRRGPKPAIGAQIVCGELRMTIQAGTSDELWRWLLDLGWREQNFRPDRRRYRDVPPTWVTRLIDAAAQDREAVLRKAVEQAAYRDKLPKSK